MGAAVTYTAGDEIAFFAQAIDKDNIPSVAGGIGAFRNPEMRSTNNDFEGFYIDDIIVGFAERGEMVVGSQTETLFDVIQSSPTEQDISQYEWTATGRDYQEQVLTGEYQLEFVAAQNMDNVVEEMMSKLFNRLIPMIDIFVTQLKPRSSLLRIR